jgi:hypothetical protein
MAQRLAAAIAADAGPGDSMTQPSHPAQPPALSRRRLLQALAAAGITGPLALELVAQSSRGAVSAETVRQASAILGESLSPERLAVAQKALQRNLDHLQIVRDLAIEDHVEPAPIFNATAAPIPGGRPAPRGRR